MKEMDHGSHRETGEHRVSQRDTEEREREREREGNSGGKCLGKVMQHQHRSAGRRDEKEQRGIGESRAVGAGEGEE